MMLVLRCGLSIGLMSLALSVPVGWAQQQATQDQSQQPQSDQSQQSPSQEQNGNNQPVPAYRSPFASAADNGALQGAEDQLTPDTRLPAGAQNLSLGAPKTGHGYWAPYVDLVSSTYTNPTTTTGALSGGIDVREISGQSDFSLSYLGGGVLGSGGGTEQNLGIVERYSLHRTTFAVMDQFGYFPQASFGYNGLGTGASSVGGNIGGNVGGNIGLQSAFTTNQYILNANGQYLSNSSLLEIDRYLTRRSSITLVGDYTLANYLDNGTLNNDSVVLQAGYNYQTSRKTTISASYLFNAFRYSNGSQSIDNHSLQVSYTRRVVGKMSFQVSAGPDYAISRVPLSASAIGSTLGNTTQWMWDANVDLTYRVRRSELGALYSHGVTAGSGVLAGSVTDVFTGTADRQFTRTFYGQLTTGFSRNSGLALLTQPFVITSTTAATAANQVYNYVFGGFNLRKTVGRSVAFTLGYQVQYQESTTATCLVTPCSTSFVSHQVFAGFGWHPRQNIRR